VWLEGRIRLSHVSRLSASGHVIGDLYNFASDVNLGFLSTIQRAHFRSHT